MHLIQPWLAGMSEDLVDAPAEHHAAQKEA